MLVAGLLTTNNERCIVRCLNSFKDRVDNIVIIDGNSTDKTVDLIRAVALVDEYTNPYPELDKTYNNILPGYNLIYNKWDKENPHMFRDQRNLLLNTIRDAYSGDNLWVLLMDSDEYISEELRDFLMDREYEKLYDREGIEMIAFNRKWWLIHDDVTIHETSFDIACGGVYSPGTIDYQVRLVRLNSEHCYNKSLHEQIEPLKNIKCLKDLDISINHKKLWNEYQNAGIYYSNIYMMLEKEGNIEKNVN